MLVEINFNRSEKKAKVRTVYNVTMFENGLSNYECQQKEYANCKLTHTGESIAIIDNDSPTEIEVGSVHVKGLYPKSLTIVTFE